MAHQHTLNRGGAIPRHAGLCYYHCNDNELENGPFIEYDVCLSFELTVALTPATAEFRMLQLRNPNTIQMRDFDLPIDDARITASVTRFYFDGV